MAGLAKTALEDIVAMRRRRIEEARARVPLGQVQGAAEARCERRDFPAALSSGALRVIAELKRASPSRGLLRSDYRPQEIALSYESAGAAALSVLTEEDLFLGSLGHLQVAREAVGLPVLRKDFILDAYQVFESVAVGADALLLIVAVLADSDLRNLLELCQRERIAALVEVHTEEELDRALATGARLVGVNNRNLKTAADLARLAAAGFNAVLIGEQLMAAPDPGRELAKLLAGAKGWGAEPISRQ